MPNDTLKREGLPPSGSAASPVPQWWDVTDGWSTLYRQRVRTFVTGSVSVGTSAAELRAGATALTNRLRLHVFNAGTDAVFLGDASVTTSTGYPLLPGKEHVWEFDAANAVSTYAIAGAAQTVLVMEEA